MAKGKKKHGLKRQEIIRTRLSDNADFINIRQGI